MASIEHHYSHHHSHYGHQIDEGVLIAGRYRLARWLGLGAVGEVWAAWDERLGRDVAVKLVPGDAGAGAGGGADPRIVDRFTREAIAVARISHPNLVAVHDEGEHQRYRFVVTELVRGRNLDELRGGRPLPIGSALAIAAQIARALEAAHAIGVPHRDIKPTTVMVGHDGVVKVLDFGVAGFLQGAGFAEWLTRTGVDSLGTPAYAAPERIAGGGDDPRSDLYSLGCVLYLLLTGLPPFPADDSLTVLHQHLHDEPVPVRHRRPEVAPQIDQLVRWLLAKEPARRPASAQAVADRLEALAATYPDAEIETASAEHEAPPEPTTKREHDGDGAHRRRRVRPLAWRHVPSVLLTMCVIGGLALGVIITRQAISGNVGVIGAVPDAGAPSLSSSPDAVSAFGTTITPNAPITPFLRHTDVTVSRPGGAPVFQAGTLNQIGTVGEGPQPFYCQSPGAEYARQSVHNYWWAWTRSAQGGWGWVSVADLSGSASDQPEPGLPHCGD